MRATALLLAALALVSCASAPLPQEEEAPIAAPLPEETGAAVVSVSAAGFGAQSLPGPARTEEFTSPLAAHLQGLENSAWLPEEVYLPEGMEPRIIDAGGSLSDEAYQLLSNYHYCMATASWTGPTATRDEIRGLCIETGARTAVVAVGLPGENGERRHELALFVPQPAAIAAASGAVGLEFRDLTGRDIDTFAPGAVIALVYQRSPAYFSGIRPGMVVKAVDGQGVDSAASAARALADAVRGGEDYVGISFAAGDGTVEKLVAVSRRR